ncbi:hypothetical protein [Streptomyces sp. NPDC127108]|uniref:hypothetical protein n=1 Tax=Streptomyces sp. NPDC127108 TaxID=3345361 RepID=UPI00363CA182
MEFFLGERDGATLLRVAESGFASLDVSADLQSQHLEGNTEGWAHEFGLLKARAERAAA